MIQSLRAIILNILSPNSKFFTERQTADEVSGVSGIRTLRVKQCNFSVTEGEFQDVDREWRSQARVTRKREIVLLSVSRSVCGVEIIIGAKNEAALERKLHSGEV